MSKLPGSDKLPRRLGDLPGSSSFRKPPEALGSSGKLREASGRLREALQSSGKAHKQGAS